MRKPEDGMQQAYAELVSQTAYDLLSYISARVSFNSQTANDEVEDLINQKLLEPVFAQFEADEWQYPQWNKFVTMVLVCNGGSNGLLNVGELNETVQTRFMRLVADQQFLAKPALAEKIIDFQIVELTINRLISTLLADLAAWENQMSEPGKEE